MLDEEAYAFLRTLSPRDRRRLEATFDSLRTRPFTEPSFIEFDSEGEALFHLFLTDYSIIYHVDHAVRMVFIQQICRNS